MIFAKSWKIVGVGVFSYTDKIGTVWNFLPNFLGEVKKLEILPLN
jgi:hypothetical protein